MEKKILLNVGLSPTYSYRSDCQKNCFVWHSVVICTTSLQYNAVNYKKKIYLYYVIFTLFSVKCIPLLDWFSPIQLVYIKNWFLYAYETPRNIIIKPNSTSIYHSWFKKKKLFGCKWLIWINMTTVSNILLYVYSRCCSELW